LRWNEENSEAEDREHGEIEETPQQKPQAKTPAPTEEGNREHGEIEETPQQKPQAKTLAPTEEGCSL